MSELIEPSRVKLIIGLICAEDAPAKECIEALRRKFGDINFISRKFPFDFTDYYEEEMGKELWRKIISFGGLITRDSLKDVKIFTNGLEKQFSSGGKRKINIDPGYIAPSHLILATGKEFYHRPYLGEGVFADLTLVYRKSEFEPLEWTYPDYKTEAMRELFKQIREKYMADLKNVSDHR